MSDATAVSDIEREEHDKTYGVKKTRMYGYDGSNLVGVKVNAQGELQIDTSGDINFKTEIRTSGNYTYIGKAVIGSATSAAVWQIKRLDTTNGLEKLFADGDDLFNNVFDSYAGLPYS